MDYSLFKPYYAVMSEDDLVALDCAEKGYSAWVSDVAIRYLQKIYQQLVNGTYNK